MRLNPEITFLPSDMQTDAKATMKMLSEHVLI